MTLGQRIQEMRKQKNLSQEALGEALGGSRQAISKWEGDQTIPELDKLIALSKLFGISLNDLLQVEQPEQPEASAPGARPAGRLGARVGALLLALCLAATGVLGAMVLDLRRQVEQLSVPIITLDPSAPIVSTMDYDLDVRNTQTHGELDVNCTMSLTMAQVTQGMQVSIQLTSPDGLVKMVEMEHKGGTAYAAVFAISRLYMPITATAVVETPGGSFTQPLLRWHSITQSSWSWDNLLEE